MAASDVFFLGGNSFGGFDTENGGTSFKEACKRMSVCFLHACCLVRWFVGGSLVLDVSDLRQRAFQMSKLSERCAPGNEHVDS